MECTRTCTRAVQKSRVNINDVKNHYLQTEIFVDEIFSELLFRVISLD